MTGFARAEGEAEGLGWAWELRSVNGRGLDLPFRLPPGFDLLESTLRAAAQRRLRRGNVNATLTIRREAAPRLAPDPAALEQVLALALDLAARIPGAPPPRAEQLLALPGVLRPVQEAGDEALPARQSAALVAGFETALGALEAARREEGGRLAAILAAQIDEIAELRGLAGAEAAAQSAAQRARLIDNLAALLRDQPGLPEERIAQEVALLATRSDVREELDRLEAHLQAARALLAEAVAVGRRFDFLVQEFNREANTLCSKSAIPALTETGLRLKAAIEQLREQVQNIE